MNEVFLTVPYSRVRYLEFPGFVNDVARIVAKYEAAAYFVDGPYNRVLLIQAEVNELEVTYRKLPKTEELMQLRTTRGIIIDTILRLLKNLRKARLASQAEMLKLVTPFLERYLATIQDTNTKLKQEHIRELGKKFDGKTPLQQALDALGLKLFVEELRTIQGNIEVAQNEQIALLPFFLDGVAQKPELFQADQIHPNGEAQPILFRNVWGALAPFQKMLKSQNP